MSDSCDVKPKADFDVILKTARSQAATMVLHPGESTGGKNNSHKNSDQWMYVTAGTGEIVIEKKRIELIPGRLILIEAGENHEVKNTGRDSLETLNIYAPPEY